MAAAPFSIAAPSTWQAGTINASLIFETIKTRITTLVIVCGVLLPPPPPAAAAAVATAREGGQGDRRQTEQCELNP